MHPRVSPVSSTRIMKPSIVCFPNPMAISPQKDWRVEWEELNRKEPKPCSESMQDVSATESIPEPSSMESSKRPKERVQEALFRTEKRPSGKEDYYCLICDPEKGPFRGQHGFRIHMKKMHMKDPLDELRRNYRSRQSVAGDIGG